MRLPGTKFINFNSDTCRVLRVYFKKNEEQPKAKSG